MSELRIGALFAGYGGLERAVQSVLGGDIAWVSDIDPGACAILAHHHPDAPNLGDITAVDWSTVEPVDVLTGGFPCQDVSAAGRRAGIRPGTRSGLWSQFAYAISQLRPGLVLIENVRGLLSASAHSDLEPCPWCVGDRADGHLRALGAVLGDLDSLGYDAAWHGVRAADVGAPHSRFRVFVLAWPRDAAADAQRPRRGAAWDAAPGQAVGGWASAVASRSGGAPALLATPRASDGEKGGPGQRGPSGDLMLPSAVALLPSGQGSAALMQDGVAGGVLPLVDGDEVGEVLDGFGAQGDVHAEGVAPISRADLAESEASFQLLPTPQARDWKGFGPADAQRNDLSAITYLLPTPAVNDMGEGKTVADWDAWTARMKAEHGNGNGHGKSLAIEAQRLPANRWGDYAPAIHHWERLTRPAPEPTQPSSKGKPQLSARFVEWMQGLPAGHVTDPAIYAHLTSRGKPLSPSAIRNLQLRALGNGVVPQQGAAALLWLLEVRRWSLTQEATA